MNELLRDDYPSSFNSYFLLLNNDMIREILYNSDDIEIGRMCQTSSQFANICNDSFFWTEKFKRKYGGLITNILYKDISKLKLNDLLTYGAENNYLILVKYAIHANASPNYDDAMCVAVKNGNLTIVEYLVEKGANIHFKNDLVLLLAAVNGNLPIIQYLVRCGSNIRLHYSALIINAIYSGELSLVQYLLPIDIIDRIGDAALRTAVEYGHISIVKCLVENGANNPTWLTNSLTYAARFGKLSIPIVTYLVEKGANLQAEGGVIVLALKNVA